MLRNFINITLRQLNKNKFYSAIHIIGLSLGIAACLIIYNLVQFEFSFDKHWNDRDQIYRVTSRFYGAFEGANRGVSTGVRSALQQSPVFEFTTPFHTISGSVELSTSEKRQRPSFKGVDMAITEPEFFDIFENWDWLYGPGPISIVEPNQVILTKKTAQKFFGVANASLLGKQIIFRDSLPLTIAAIIDDPTVNTDFQFEGYISFSTISQSWLKDRIPADDWSNTNSSSLLFVKLSEGYTREEGEESTMPLEARYVDENPEASWKVDYQLQPLSDMHYNAKLGIFNSGRSPANKNILGALGILGFFLLLLACFNFVNLETAKSALRAKEIGVRKVLGSSRSNLIFQLLSETTFLSFLSLILAIPLIYLVLPLFDEFFPINFVIDFHQPHLIGATIAVVLMVSLLSGMYPAWLASSSNPSITIRQGGMSSVGSGGRGVVRKVLVSVQFFLVQILVLGTLIVYQQTQFVINKDMGFTKDAILHFKLPYYQDQSSKDIFKSKIDQISSVANSSMFTAPPAHNGWSSSIMSYEQNGNKLEIDVHQKRADTAYLSLFQIPLIAGRNVQAHDSILEFVINETLARSMGFDHPADAIGSTLELSDDLVPIVGIAKDFHVLNLHEAIKPVALSFQRKGSLGVKVAAGHWEQVDQLVDQAKTIWSGLWPETDFSMVFMDEAIENLYRQEKRTSKLIVSVTGLALFISCLGLLGLVGFLAHQRTREIGIRKVLGASNFNIVRVFTKDFLTWVTIAIVPATGIGLLIMNRWLDQFAYTFNLNISTILVAATLCLFAVVTTVVVQSLRAAKVNPALSLKNE